MGLTIFLSNAMINAENNIKYIKISRELYENCGKTPGYGKNEEESDLLFFLKIIYTYKLSRDGDDLESDEGGCGKTGGSIFRDRIKCIE